jgi:hypothetical protein
VPKVPTRLATRNDRERRRFGLASARRCAGTTFAHGKARADLHSFESTSLRSNRAQKRHRQLAVNDRPLGAQAPSAQSARPIPAARPPGLDLIRSESRLGIVSRNHAFASARPRAMSCSGRRIPRAAVVQSSSSAAARGGTTPAARQGPNEHDDRGRNEGLKTSLRSEAASPVTAPTHVTRPPNSDQLSGDFVIRQSR